MVMQIKYKYDVFISYSHKDEQWVTETLLPRLEEASLKVCIHFRDFEPGTAALKNMQVAEKRSHHTLLVMTPSWVASEWTLYEASLARTRDPAGLKRRTIPLLLEKCRIPEDISILTYVDFTRADREDLAWRKLLAALGARPKPLVLPDAVPAPNAVPAPDTVPVPNTPSVGQGRKMCEETAHESAARRHVTELCLIAADVDKTVLTQTVGERNLFLRRLAPQLLDSAKMGMKLAFVTGNSMSQLTDRFLKWLLDHLCHTDDLALLPQFHFFCNSGGVYFHFGKDDEGVAKLLREHPTGQRELADRLFDLLTLKDDDGTTFVRPSFVDAIYLARTQIPPDEVGEIKRALEKCGTDYLARLEKRRVALAVKYDLSKVMKNRALVRPAVEVRSVKYIAKSAPELATVQLTLKPILTFRHGVSEEMKALLFENDLRTEVIQDIQRSLDAAGLGHYVARPGGRTSIDVTLEKLDKAYAMEFLIDHLNLQGHARQGQGFGANAIYFGDEVIVGGGNDYAVTRIPGLLVFAVNPDKGLVPFLSHVFVPSSILEGPEATAHVLGQLNDIARTSLETWSRGGGYPTGCSETGSAIDCFKIKVFGERIHTKIEALKSSGKLTPDEWQILHAFVTLMHRDDLSARHWLSILVDELDAIMKQLSEFPKSPQGGIGTSHPDQ